MTQQLTSSQLRAARALLDWSRAELAKQTGVSEPTIHRLENNIGEAETKTQNKIRRILEFRGIEFTENSGVRFKSSDIEIYEGPERFEEFTDFLYEHLKHYGGDVCLSATDERLFAKFRRNPELHRRHMKELVDRGDVNFRILAAKIDYTATYAEYRYQPEQETAPTAFYAFGNCLALISFAHPTPPYVVLHKSGPFAEAYRQAFNIAWKHAKEPARQKG